MSLLNSSEVIQKVYTTGFNLLVDYDVTRASHGFVEQSATDGNGDGAIVGGIMGAALFPLLSLALDRLTGVHSANPRTADVTGEGDNPRLLALRVLIGAAGGAVIGAMLDSNY